MRVVFLGTKGGPPPSPESCGISTAVVVDDAVYLVDAGRAAVTQYVRAGLRFSALRAVFVTHLHADHVADYFNIFLLGGHANPHARDSVRSALPVFGPGRAGGLPEPFGGGDVATANPAEPTPGLATLTDLSAAAHAYSTNVFMRDSSIRDARPLADVTEIDVNGLGASFARTSPPMDPILVMEDDLVRVSAVLVPHGPAFPAFAYRFDSQYGSVTLSGDTTYSDNLVTLARDTDLLVHEAINVRGFQGPPALVDHLLEGHVEVQEVGTVAAKCGARQLALSHVGDLTNGVVDPWQWREWAQKGYDGPVVVPQDLDTLVVTAHAQ